MFCYCRYYHHDFPFPRNSHTGFSLATIHFVYAGPPPADFSCKFAAFIQIDAYYTLATMPASSLTNIDVHQSLDCNSVILPTDPTAYPDGSHVQRYNTIRQFCSSFDPGPGCFCGPDLQVVCVAGLGTQRAHQEWNLAKATAACYQCRCSWGRGEIQEMIRFKFPQGGRTGISKIVEPRHNEVGRD